MTAETAGDERPMPGDGPPAAAAAGEHEINPLQRLIRQRLAERGWSYGEVARRGGLPRSTVYALAKTRNLARPPRPATIDALARGLDVPVSAVRAAAAESTGLHYYGEPSARTQDPDDRERELLIASIDELTPEERRHVAALVESLRNRASRGADGRLAPPAHLAPGGMPGQVIPELIRSRIRLLSSASGCRSPRPALGMKPRTLRPSWSRRRNNRPVSHAPASAGQGRNVADPSGARQATPSCLSLYSYVPRGHTPFASARRAWRPGDSCHTRSALQQTSSRHRLAPAINSSSRRPR
jgi:transcriptional regulator with XRE-family HTH domain